MKALILNSGMGRRMGALTDDRPKCMTAIGGGFTILSRQLRQLECAGISEVIITTGPFADALRQHVEDLALSIPVRYSPTPNYAATNYIVSIHCAAPLLTGDDVLLLHGDLVLEDSVLQDLLEYPANAVAVDHSLPLPEKDFKAKITSDYVTAIGVELSGNDCVACQPAYKWSASGFARWLTSIAVFISCGETGVYAEKAFNALDGTLPLVPLDLHGRLCCEIDNPQDLKAVSARFLQLLL